jgi:CheY-like chemotaxis protein
VSEGSDTVLVVDDDSAVRTALKELFETEGYDVAVAANGRAALNQLRLGVRPCVVLLDLMMPVMDGWQFRTEQLRDAALREIPVVVMTASRLTGDDALNGAEILQKPVALAQILEAVERNARAA